MGYLDPKLPTVVDKQGNNNDCGFHVAATASNLFTGKSIYTPDQIKQKSGLSAEKGIKPSEINEVFVKSSIPCRCDAVDGNSIADQFEARSENNIFIVQCNVVRKVVTLATMKVDTQTDSHYVVMCRDRTAATRSFTILDSAFGEKIPIPVPDGSSSVSWDKYTGNPVTGTNTIWKFTTDRVFSVEESDEKGSCCVVQ